MSLKNNIYLKTLRRGPRSTAKANPPPPRKPSNPDVGLAIWAGVTLLLSAIVPNVAMVACFVTIPAALIIPVKRFLTGGKLSWVMCVACLALFISGPGGLVSSTWLIKNSLKPTISSLEDYKAKNGSYPSNLKELQPASNSSSTGSRSGIMYYTDGQAYSLTCVTFGFNKLTYSSSSKTWRNWD